eukprot:4965721-Pleurochrysis_carterae.AAC.1
MSSTRTSSATWSSARTTTVSRVTATLCAHPEPPSATAQRMTCTVVTAPVNRIPSTVARGHV